MSAWTSVERTYSLWLRTAREKKGSAAALARGLEAYLCKTNKLQPDADLRELGVPELTGRTISRWERGTEKKPQPQYPVDPWSREALIAVVTELVPVPPTEKERDSFQDVCEAFDAERQWRIKRGAGNLESHAAQGRNEDRHQFLATWPAPASELDPIKLGLGSWAFDGALPPYVQRTVDDGLAARLNEPGITTVTGAPKSGKSRSILEVLQRHHPGALTWWVNPSPTVLPLVVENATKARGSERPTFIVLDDAGLIGTDPVGGLTAQRVHDLTATCTHLIIVIHTQTLARWEHQLSNRTADKFDSGSVGSTRELMELLGHRIRYESVLNDEETEPAAEMYENADERAKSFDLTRLAETLAGVETLKRQATHILETSTGTEAALLEAAIDASIAFPTGTTEDILTLLAGVHFRRRQPNRLWRRHLIDEALDTLTTGITTESPHAIITLSGEAFRLLDALAPELQAPDRDTRALVTALKECQISEDLLLSGLLSIGEWHSNNERFEEAHEAWTEAVEKNSSMAAMSLGYLANRVGDHAVAISWFEKAHELDKVPAAADQLGHLKHGLGDVDSARTWWERAAVDGHGGAMLELGDLDSQRGETASARFWWEQAARKGHPVAMDSLGSLSYHEQDFDSARFWWERAARKGWSLSLEHLAELAYEMGDRRAAEEWLMRAADRGLNHALLRLGRIAQNAGELDSARVWWERAADKGLPWGLGQLAKIAFAAGDVETAYLWWERAEEKGLFASIRLLRELAIGMTRLPAEGDAVYDELISSAENVAQALEGKGDTGRAERLRGFVMRAHL